MKSRTLTLFTAMAFFTALAITLQLSAQTSPNKIITFDAPGAGKGVGEGTFAYGINPSGAIAGWDIDTNFRFHGFLRAEGGRITIFDAPGAGKERG